MLRQGAPIGAVGSTGNADPNAPHLHFAISTITPERNWWEDGAPLNPFPLLPGR
jgi:murein DD-endopeptidase MepM/ murein hydrolase activator NlpD